MKSIVLISVVCAAVALLVISESLAQASRVSNWQEWRAYKQKYGKSYATPEEDAQRFALYLRSKAKLMRATSGGESHVRGINHLSDWTEAELKQLGGLKFPAGQPLQTHLNNSEESQGFLMALLEDGDDKSPLPEEVDWRKVEGVVTPVKDQKHCGACWAFATTGLLEGQQMARYRSSSLVALSEQDLVDCSKGDYGCGGGLMTNALKDVATMGGIESEQAYPYEGLPYEQEPCRFKKSKAVMTAAGSAMLPQDENQMKKIVAKYGPVSVGVASADLHDYASGIYTNDRCFTDQGSLDHAVLIVGYGTDPVKGDYWIVKNSWSTHWGEQGYLRISRGKNTCGINQFPVIATF